MNILAEGVAQVAHQMMWHHRRIPSRLTWNCKRKAKLKGSSANRPIVSRSILNAHSLTAVIESVINPSGSGSVLSKEAAIDQPPEVEDAANNVRVPTFVDAPRGGIPFVACGLQRFVEGRVKFDVSRRIQAASGGYVEGVPVRCDTENNLVDWETSARPSFHG